jgi:hypothetical protein
MSITLTINATDAASLREQLDRLAIVLSGAQTLSIAPTTLVVGQETPLDFGLSRDEAPKAEKPKRVRAEPDERRPTGEFYTKAEVLVDEPEMTAEEADTHVEVEAILDTDHTAVAKAEIGDCYDLDYDADVKPKITALAAKSRQSAIDVLATFGAKNGKELKPEDYAAFIAAADEALAS